MGKFVTLVIGCVLVIGLLMFGGADMLRQLNAPALADAQARISEANMKAWILFALLVIVCVLALLWFAYQGVFELDAFLNGV